MGADHQLPWRAGFRIEWRGRAVDAVGLGEKLSAWLGRVPPGQVVALGGSRLFQLIAALVAPSAGVAVLPLDKRLPADHQARLMALAEAVPAARSLGDRSSGSVRPLGLDDTWLFLPTSGTTGRPRLVELAGRQLLASARAVNRRLELSENQQWLLCLPTFHIAGLAVGWRCALAGAGVVIVEGFDPDQVLARLSHGDISHLSLVPTQLHRLLERRPHFRPPPALRMVLLGGAPASKDLVARAIEAGWPVAPTYGLTEATSQVAACQPAPARWTPGLAGRPLDHLEVALGSGGEIRLRGEALARWVREGDGRRHLLDTQGWLTTGDLGRFTPEGELQVLGRADEVVISGGEKIHPALVEAHLAGLPGVRALAVAGVADEKWGRRLVLFYEGEAPPDQVSAALRARLQGPWRPRQVVRLDRLPRTATGKVRRSRLAALVSGQSGK